MKTITNAFTKDSWKTSLCGLIVTIAIAVEPCLSDQWKPVAAKAGELAGALGFLFAADARRAANAGANNATQQE